MASLVRRVPFGQVFPRGSGTQDPENPVENISGVAPGTASTVASAGWLGDQGLQELPLLVGEVHRGDDPQS